MIPALSSTTAYSVAQLPTRPGQPGQPEGAAVSAKAAVPSDRPASQPQDAQQAATPDLRAEQRVAGAEPVQLSQEQPLFAELTIDARRRERLEALEEAQAQREQRAAAMVEYQQQMAEVQARLAEVQQRLAQLGVLDPQYLLGGLIDDQA